MKKIFYIFILITINCNGNQSQNNSLATLLQSLVGQTFSAPVTVSQSSDFSNITPPNPNDVVIAVNSGVIPTLPPNLDLSFVSAPGGSGALIRSLKLEIDNLEYTNASVFNFGDKEVRSLEKKIVRITNSGTDSLNLVKVEVSSSSEQFRFINSFSYSGNTLVTLSPNQFVMFELQFEPNSSGSKIGSLKILSDDKNIPEKLLEIKGSGTISPNAIIMKPQHVVSRSEPIIIEFSHSMDKSSICPENEPNNSFPGTNVHGGNRIRISKDLNTNNFDVSGYCYWNTFRQLVIDPLENLDPNTRYYLDLTDARLFNSTTGLNCVRRVDESNCPGSNKTTSFVTEPSFQFNVVINSNYPIHPTNNSKSAIINQTNVSQVQIETSISDVIEADQIILKKLNNPPTSDFIQWNPSLNLSTISQSTLRPSQGSNTYYIDIKKGPKHYYRVFGFMYGKTASDPTVPIDSIARINIGNGINGIDRIGKLLERLFKSSGNLAPSSDNFRIAGKNFSEPYAELTGTTSSNCARIKVTNVTNIQVGHVLRGASLPPNSFVTEIISAGSIGSGDGCPNNSTFNTAPLIRLSRPANDGFGSTGSNIKITTGPDFGKLANITNGSNQISFVNSSEIFPGVYINHPNLPAGTTIIGNINENLWTLSNISSASLSNTTVTIGKSFMQNPKRTGNVLTGIDALGQNCLSNPNDFGTAKELNHLLSIGPFCRISWSWGGFIANGRSDVYVTNMTIENTANGTPDNNLLVNLIPSQGSSSNGQLNINLNGKRLKGTLRLFMHSGGGLAGGLANGAVYDVDFLMSPGGGCNSGSDFLNYSTSTGFHSASAMTSLSIPDSNGLIGLNIINPNAWRNNESATEFNVSNWDANICAYNVRTIKPGTFDSIIQAVLESVIPGIQWRVVQGVIRDTIQTVTPNILNALFYQLRKDSNANGIDIDLPDFLPPPFDRTKINLGVNLKQNSSNRIFSDGMDLSGSISVLVCQKLNSNSSNCVDRNTLDSKPETPHIASGYVNSFLLYSNGTAPRSQLNKSTVNGNQGTGRINQTDGSGVLLSLHSDAINQTLYQLWWNGVLNLKLDQNFADKIRNFRGSNDRVFQIFQTLLKANSILKVLAPGRNKIHFRDRNGILRTVQSTDDIIIRVEPLLPPNVYYSNPSLASTNFNKKTPLLDLEWSDLILRIYGKNGSEEYLLTSLKIGISTKLLLGMSKFTSGVGCQDLNPEKCIGNENPYYKVSAIQLNLCDDNNLIDIENSAAPQSSRRIDCDSHRTGFNDSIPNNDLDLFYVLEVLESNVDNPSGLNSEGIREVFDPTIQRLIIPVLNYVLEYIPLEKKNPNLFVDSSYISPNYSYISGRKEDPNAPGNKLAANCGLRLNDINALQYSIDYFNNSSVVTETSPYILINLKLSDYQFWGNCTL